MHPIPALIVTEQDLEVLLQRAAHLAAITAIEQLRTDLIQDPKEQVLNKLRAFIKDRSTITNPREHWANGKMIREIDTNHNNKPKSISWFQLFKKQSTLNQCPRRKSSEHGKLQEWTFEDIANAWDHFHRLRWMGEK